MKAYKFITACAVAAACCACRNGKEFQPVHLVLPSPPTVMEQNARVAYAAQHFWDDITKPGRNYPCDSTLVSGVLRSEVEEAMSSFIILLEQLPLDEAQKSVEYFSGRLIACEKADTASNVFEQLSSLVQRYFYDPNSPLRDEDLYTPFANTMASCSLVPQQKRKAFGEEARKTALNVRGSVAADFIFCDKKGRNFSLHGIKSEYVILFFSNPGCTSCKEIIEALSGSELVNIAVSERLVSVLNIYIDEKMDEWYEYMPIYPKTWYNGFDAYHAIRNEELYDVRAIPSLYLLDKEKRVILKDAPLERLMNILPALLQDKLTIEQQ